jgi:hypothetical protein
MLPEKLTNPERLLSVIDDRAAFEEKKRRQALALAQDQHLFADAIDMDLDPGQTPSNRSKVCFKGNEPLSALEAYLKETDRFETDPVVNGS